VRAAGAAANFAALAEDNFNTAIDFENQGEYIQCFLNEQAEFINRRTDEIIRLFPPPPCDVCTDLAEAIGPLIRNLVPFFDLLRGWEWPSLVPITVDSSHAQEAARNAVAAAARCDLPGTIAALNDAEDNWLGTLFGMQSILLAYDGISRLQMEINNGINIVVHAEDFYVSCELSNCGAGPRPQANAVLLQSPIDPVGLPQIAPPNLPIVRDTLGVFLAAAAASFVEGLTPQPGLYYFLLQKVDTDPSGVETLQLILRGKALVRGDAFRNLFLAPTTHYRAYLVNVTSRQVGHTDFVTGSAGTTATIPVILMADDSSPDEDHDGLGTEAERVVGTDPQNPDSDGDGIPDGTEVSADTNPLDGRPAITGVIATADTPGKAVDVCTANGLAFVADSTAGVAIFNIANGTTPLRLAQVDTPGDARAVCLSGNFLAVADGNSGLAIVDVSDAANARLVRQVALPGYTWAVAACGNRAFAGSIPGGTGSTVHYITEIDLPSGGIRGTLQLPGFELEDVVVHEEVLYALQVDKLNAI